MKVAARSLLALFLLAPLLWAAEPWKEKPYTEWTQEDVQRIFLDSPWAGPAAVSRLTGDRTNLLFLPLEPLGPSSMTGQIIVTGPPPGFFAVQWVSALTVREAIVRQRQLQGQVDEEQAARFLAERPADYVVVVFGPNMGFFEGLKEEGTRQGTYLEFLPSKRRVAPAGVRFVRRGSQLAAVEFRFPRQAPGEAPVGTDEEQVRFRCRSTNQFTGADFDLRKMVRDGKPDL